MARKKITEDTEEELEEGVEGGVSQDVNPDDLEAALGDDFVEIDEEVTFFYSKSDDEEDPDIDLAFVEDDTRDWL